MIIQLYIIKYTDNVFFLNVLKREIYILKFKLLSFIYNVEQLNDT